MKISSLDDIQKLEAKDLREILKYNLKSTGWIRADLVLKVYALLMWHVLPSSNGENREPLTDVQDLEQNQNDFRYKVTMVRISALGWASNLRNLPEMNFSQLYDYPVVSREYRHIMLRGTHYRKYHRSCSVWLRKWGKGYSPLGRGYFFIAAVVDVVFVVVPYSSVKVVPILFTKMSFSLPFVHFILWETIQWSL